MTHTDGNYWEQRWKDGTTGWDIGSASGPLVEYANQLTNRALRILIPGAGNAYEAEHLWKKGFRNVFVMDISPTALESFSSRVPDFPKSQMLCEDFFQHTGQYDLILEQTFYCAIDPALRDDYVQQVHHLLAANGKLVGLLWDAPMNDDRPPYGGDQDEYRNRFSPLFAIKTMETAHNSIAPRAGREAFVIFQKR